MISSIEGLPHWRHLALDDVGSTNVEAFHHANEGDAGRLWVTARSQSAGKARRGRSWDSENGNLYASLLLIEPGSRDALHTLPITVSLALHKAVAATCPAIGDRLTIKWPNDLLLDGKKLSGILLEAMPDRHGRLAVVIGCGVNCQQYPEAPLYPATSLAQAGFDVQPDQLFQALAHSLADELRIWAEGQGFSIIRREWLERCAGQGKPIVARFEDHELHGIFVDMDADGFLLLKDATGLVHQISAADIFFGN